MPRSPQETEETKSLFDAWAATYDEDVNRPTGLLVGYEESLHRAAAMVPLPANAGVLDVGIGTGAFARLLANGGARLSGVDVSSEMLARCQANHPSFALATGSFLQIPHPDGHFDALVSSFAFHEVSPEERPRACAESARVIRPGGRVCLLDIMFASPAARTAAARELREQWDPDEVYPLVGDLDVSLRSAGFTGLRWQQTGPYHWAVAGCRFA